MRVFRVGPHVVANEDLLELDIDAFLSPYRFDLVYMDPPWGEANLKYWQTMNVKQNNAPRREVNLSALLHKIFYAISKYMKRDGVAFIEYGQRWRELIHAYAVRYDLRHNAVIECRYRSGKGFYPLDLHIISHKPIALTHEYIKSVHHTHGYRTVKTATTPFVRRGGYLLDLCCGCGYSARLAVESGMVFVGNELNMKRLQKTMERLRRDGQSIP